MDGLADADGVVVREPGLGGPEDGWGRKGSPLIGGGSEINASLKNEHCLAISGSERYLNGRTQTINGEHTTNGICIINRRTQTINGQRKTSPVKINHVKSINCHWHEDNKVSNNELANDPHSSSPNSRDIITESPRKVNGWVASVSKSDVELCNKDVVAPTVGQTISEQIVELSDAKKLDQNDRERIDDLYQFVSQVFSPIFPGCTVHCFGSSINGLGCKESDVDIHLDLENQLNPDRSIISKKRKFGILEEVIQGREECTDVQSIPQARVPVIKFKHSPTQLNCDLSFKNMMGTFNSHFIKQCVGRDSRFLPLFMTIKYLAKSQGLLGGGGGGERMTSYALTLLLIFYFQQLECPIFPPVASVINFKDEDPNKNINGWIYAFNLEKSKNTKENTMDLEHLLTGFFEFYSTFYYEFIISPYFATEVSRESFKAKQLVGMDLWLENTYQKASKHFKWCFDDTTVYKRGLQVQSPLCVQDPFELNHNVTKNVDYTTLRRFRQLCGEAVNVFTYVHRPINGCGRSPTAGSPRLRSNGSPSPKSAGSTSARSPHSRGSSVKLQELLQIRVPDAEFDEYSDRHLIPAISQTQDWPPLSSNSPSRPTPEKSNFRLTTPSNQLICYLCGISSCKYDSFVHLRGHLLEKHRSITRKLYFRPVEVMEVIRTADGRLSHSLGLLQNIVCMAEFITHSQDELRFEFYEKKEYSGTKI